ncbi:MAG: lipid A deacylase LpxR family protein [Syntrophales bacterium]|jgi:hypothetical protein|nr:lipid A deacylase LpxR family protein [Syntrophales bacterium]MDY0043145.1 lipid A deacylase LpxR family protein [Syntrophales bacterium]
MWFNCNYNFKSADFSATHENGIAVVKTFLLFFLCFFFIFRTPAFGDEVQNSWTFSLYIENDTFTNTDRHYTNGIKLTWISPDLTSYAQGDTLPGWALHLVQMLPFINEKGLQRNIALSIGQNMYTPEDTGRTDLIVNDRPYAGWTYGSISLHSKNDRRLDSFELQAGMIGPQSYAGKTQNLWHDIIGVAKPKGWENQIKNEPGLAFIYERKLRTLRVENGDGLGFDMIAHLGASLGNVYTYGNLGFETRFGLNIPLDFGTGLIRPAGSTNAPVERSGPGSSQEQTDFGLYLFIAAEGRAVARDIFLEGNTFTSSHSVDKNPFVADLTAGLSMIAGPFKISYAYVYRTKEFEEQRDGHAFGSITLSFTY